MSVSKVMNESIIIGVTMKRNFVYHLATTYMPTTCLLSIVLLTLYIPEERFEATIMVALTSMLVMYTLYQSVSETLPKTSYIKLIDGWLLFCLFLPFLVFLVLIRWELETFFRFKSDKIVKVGPPNLPLVSEKSVGKKPFTCNRSKVRSWLIGMTIAFVFVYTVVSWLVYNF